MQWIQNNTKIKKYRPAVIKPSFTIYIISRHFTVLSRDKGLINKSIFSLSFFNNSWAGLVVKDYFENKKIKKDVMNSTECNEDYFIDFFIISCF